MQSMFTFILFPLLGALLGWLIIRFLLWLCMPSSFSKDILKKVPSLFKGKKIPPQVIQKQLDKVDWHQELDSLVDQKLNLFIENLQKRIPMVGSLLKGPLADSLKGQAKEQFADMIPEMKAKMASQMSDKLDLEALLEEQLPKMIDPDHMEEILLSEMKRPIIKMSVFGASVGFILGLVVSFL